MGFEKIKTHLSNTLLHFTQRKSKFYRLQQLSKQNKSAQNVVLVEKNHFFQFNDENQKYLLSVGMLIFEFALFIWAYWTFWRCFPGFLLLLLFLFQDLGGGQGLR